MRFAKDRQRWLRWLFEAKKRYGTRILSYAVTSNHIHLLVQDRGGREVLPQTMQLVAGRTAQEYNRRKNRKGAFWEDRYHATAVQEDSHLVRCMVYIDLNMVRAGVVQHPSEWPFCGYNEIQDPPQRYVLIDRERLISLLGGGSPGRFSETYKGWVEEALGRDGNVRDGKWSESIAVGTKSFVERIKDKLGFKAVGREAVPAGDAFELKETVVAYKGSSMGKTGPLSPDNTYPWRGSWDKSI